MNYFLILSVFLFSSFSLEGSEVRRSKYFLALKRNDGNVLNHLDEYTSLLPPRGLLYADPMLFKQGDTNYIFFETYDYQKGVIEYVTINKDLTFSDPVRVLELDEHLSFPSLFEDDGHIYMTPETIASKEVALFEAIDFPNHWEKKRVLVSGEDFTDAMIFKHEGLYYLFTAVNMEQIRIYYAPDLNSEFKPHPINAKKLIGRTAGQVFHLNGDLIRPVMDCSKVYGGAMFLKKIVTLTPTTFIEEPILHIDATWAPNLNGTHTFNMNDDFVIYDGRRSILPSEDSLYSAH